MYVRNVRVYKSKFMRRGGMQSHVCVCVCVSGVAREQLG